MCQAITEGGKRCPIHRQDVSALLHIFNQRLHDSTKMSSVFSLERKIAVKNNLNNIIMPTTKYELWKELKDLDSDNLILGSDPLISGTDQSTNEYFFTEDTSEDMPDAATYIALKNTLLKTIEKKKEVEFFKRELKMVRNQMRSVKNLSGLASAIYEEKINSYENKDNLDLESLKREALNDVFLLNYRIPKDAIYPAVGTYSASPIFPYYDVKQDMIFVVNLLDNTFIGSKLPVSSNVNKDEILSTIQSEQLTSLNPNVYESYDKFHKLFAPNEHDTREYSQNMPTRCPHCGQFTSNNSRSLHLCLTGANVNNRGKEEFFKYLANKNDLNIVQHLRLVDYYNTRDATLVPFLSEEDRNHFMFEVESISPKMHLSDFGDEIDPKVFKDALTIIDFEHLGDVQFNIDKIEIFKKGDTLPNEYLYDLRAQKVIDALDEGEHYIYMQQNAHTVLALAGYITKEEPLISKYGGSDYSFAITKNYANSSKHFEDSELLTEESIKDKNGYVLALDESAVYGSETDKYLIPIDKLTAGIDSFFSNTNYDMEKPYNSVEGSLVLKFDKNKGIYIIDKSESQRALKCDCPNYAQSYRCEHIDLSIFELDRKNESQFGGTTLQRFAYLRDGSPESALKYMNHMFNDNLEIVVTEEYPHGVVKAKENIDNGRDYDFSRVYSDKNSLFYDMDKVEDTLVMRNFKRNLINEKFKNGLDINNKEQTNELLESYNTLLSLKHYKKASRGGINLMRKAAKGLKYQVMSNPMVYVEDAQVVFTNENKIDHSINEDPVDYTTNFEVIISPNKNTEEEVLATPRNLKCDCPDYIEKYDCEHVRTVRLMYTQDENLEDSTEENFDAVEFSDYILENFRRTKQHGESLGQHDVDNYLTSVESLRAFLGRIPQIQNETVEKPLNGSDEYILDVYRNVEQETEEIKQYLDDEDSIWKSYKDVQNRKARKVDYLTFDPHANITNGIFAPETGLKFGLEIEVVEMDHKDILDEKAFNIMEQTHGIKYDNDEEKEKSYKLYMKESTENMDKRKKLLLAAMKSLQYTNQKEVQNYHSSKNTEERMSQWTIEHDSTVDIEIVSPPLSDSPESWNQINNVTYLLKRYGFAINSNCGGHINVSTSDHITSQDLYHTTKVVHNNFAMFQRLGQDVKAGRHRGTEYCEPIFEDDLGLDINNSTAEDEQLYKDYVTDYTDDGEYSALKIHDSRLEFRLFDGSLEPSTLQHRLGLVSNSMVAGMKHSPTHIDETLYEEIDSYADDYYSDSEKDIRSLKSREENIMSQHSETTRHSKESFARESAILKDFVSKLATNKKDAQRLTELYAATFWNSNDH